MKRGAWVDRLAAGSNGNGRSLSCRSMAARGRGGLALVGNVRSRGLYEFRHGRGAFLAVAASMLTALSMLAPSAAAQSADNALRGLAWLAGCWAAERGETGRVEGLRHGVARGIDFPMHRVPCVAEATAR